jgi:hypothetical protein
MFAEFFDDVDFEEGVDVCDDYDDAPPLDIVAGEYDIDEWNPWEN